MSDIVSFFELSAEAIDIQLDLVTSDMKIVQDQVTIEFATDTLNLNSFNSNS